jgi:hypothetical protein
MNHIGGGILVLGLGLSMIAPEHEGPDQPSAPAEQYKALLKDFENASSSGRFLSDEERLQFIGRVFRLRNQLAIKFVKLAEKYPEDPFAVDALLQAIWHVNTTPWPVELVGKDEASSRALALLQRDHLRSEKLGPPCQRISYGFCKAYEAFLRAVLELAHFLVNRVQRLDLIREQPELAKEFGELFGEEYLEELQWQDRTRVIREAESLFERASTQYGDLKLPEGGTVDEKARAELFEIRHLVVGKEAPEIVGEDQDGKRLKLSDYRGKVVLLDFWSEY